MVSEVEPSAMRLELSPTSYDFAQDAGVWLA
jgi:hypothetical protein